MDMDWKWIGWGVFLMTCSFSLFHTMGHQAKDNARVHLLPLLVLQGQ